MRATGRRCIGINRKPCSMLHIHASDLENLVSQVNFTTQCQHRKYNDETENLQ